MPPKTARPGATSAKSASKSASKSTASKNTPVAPNKAHILSIQGLNVVRGGIPILTDLCWDVSPKQHWAILGANGSGKTSLLSILTGYLNPTGGTIRVLDQQYGHSNWIELRKSIGIVSSSIRQAMPDHEPALTTVISGKYAMIEYWGSVKRADKAEAEAILKQVHCEHLADRPWLVLSQESANAS